MPGPKCSNREKMPERGRSFEIEVMRRLEMELQSGMLGIDPAWATVFHRRKYPSPDRGKPIVVDVAVEVTRPGAAEPFLTWIWECKDHVRPVPVGAVEEFQAKLMQIGASRCKGTVASRSGFQESAVNTARKWGIGLVRMHPDGSLVRLFEHSISARDPRAEALAGLVQPLGAGPRSAFYAIAGNGAPASRFHDYLREELGPPPGG